MLETTFFAVHSGWADFKKLETITNVFTSTSGQSKVNKGTKRTLIYAHRQFNDLSFTAALMSGYYNVQCSFTKTGYIMSFKVAVRFILSSAISVNIKSQEILLIVGRN